MSPPQARKSFSPSRSRIGASSGARPTGRATKASAIASSSPSLQTPPSKICRTFDRQAERDEDDDLGEAGERRVEALDLPLVRHVEIAEGQAGDEDREEARPVRDRGQAVDHAGRRERPQRVQALARQAHAPHEDDEQRRSGDADREPDRHLEEELPHDRPARCAVGRGELDHPDQERDPDRVVHARLALEDRPRVAADLLVTEDREHDGRVGRGERRAEHSGQGPAEVEQEMGADGRSATAVVSVPMMPSVAIGTIARRNRRQPMFMPPSKRIRTTATTPIRSTVLMCGRATGSASAARRKSAGAGTG